MTNIASGDINIDSKGKGCFQLERAFIEFNSADEYIEINIYKDSTCQDLIARQLIAPVIFDF